MTRNPEEPISRVSLQHRDRPFFGLDIKTRVSVPAAFPSGLRHLR